MINQILIESMLLEANDDNDILLRIKKYCYIQCESIKIDFVIENDCLFIRETKKSNFDANKFATEKNKLLALILLKFAHEDIEWNFHSSDGNYIVIDYRK